MATFLKVNVAKSQLAKTIKHESFSNFMFGLTIWQVYVLKFAHFSFSINLNFTWQIC